MDYRERFDALFERGASAVLAGSHYRDSPPVEGGRWGMSVVLTPDPTVTALLESLTTRAMAIAGPGHWPTGAAPAVHLTVRAIDVHRGTLDSALVARCSAALRRATAASPPIRLRLHGLTLTPSGVMACAYPTDAAASRFADRLCAELGADAWFERQFDRNIWYATLVHFTTDLAKPAALVRWVADHRDTPFGAATFAAADLVRFTYNAHQPIRMALADSTFAITPIDADQSTHR